MTSPLKIALLYGGPSGEHEIALRSAASVIANLDQQRYQVFPIGIDKAGCCFYNPLDTLLPLTASLPVKTAQSTPLAGLLINGQFVMDVDVVFPMVHGPLLEDGALQGVLSLAQIAYVGCDVLGSAICMHKDLARQLARQAGILSPPYQVLSIHATTAERNAFCEQVIQEFGFPLFVKPCCMGSSVGTHKITDASDLKGAIEDAFRFDDVLLAEQGIQGLEIELAILENTQPCLPPDVSVPGELKVRHPDGFYSYHAKYIDSDLTELCIPASLPEALIQALQQTAARLFILLKCKGLARADFFVDPVQQKIYFNELNTLPGFTSISMYPRLWEASGLSYAKLLDRLIVLACVTHQQNQKKIRDFQ